MYDVRTVCFTFVCEDVVKLRICLQTQRIYKKKEKKEKSR